MIVDNYRPENVNISKCGHTTEEPHFCVNDWRYDPWGNLPRQFDESA